MSGIITNSAAAGPSELKLQIVITTDKTVLELKEAIAEKSDVEADRQRLIYSGVFSARVTTNTHANHVPGRVLKVRLMIWRLIIGLIAHSRMKMRYRLTRSSRPTQYTWSRVSLDPALRLLNRALPHPNRYPPCKPGKTPTTRSLS
jgi:hypothetical protein